MSGEGCGKRPFANAALAQRAMNETVRRTRWRAKREKASAYFCKLCGAWHWGRLANPRRKRR